MNRIIVLLAMIFIPALMNAQDASNVYTATLKINNIHIDLNGEKIDWDNAVETTLTDGQESQVIIYEKDGLRYGCKFTYKKGKNRLKLVRKCFAMKAGNEPNYSKQKKDMQEIKTSIPGSLNKRVVENIVLNKETLEAINVSFNYELIYK